MTTTNKASGGYLETLALATLSEQELVAELGRRVWQRHSADRRTGVTVAQVKKVLRECGLPPKMRPSEDAVFGYAVKDLIDYTKQGVADIKAHMASTGVSERMAFDTLIKDYHKAARTAIYVFLTGGSLPVAQ